MQDSYHFWDSRPTENLWWATRVRDFCSVSPLLEPVFGINDRSLKANVPKIEWAAACRAQSINVPQYLLYLQEKAKTLGVKVIKARLPIDAGFEQALSAAENIAQSNGGPKVDLFLNATGLGAAKLCSDKAMYPIRGQTVLVKGEATATRTRYGEGYVAYCIPRPGSGSTILGGTKEAGNWSEQVDPTTTENILKRTALLAPELLTGEDGGFEAVSVQCGLRPGRQGGPRMEKEVVGGRKVVHAYGHASGGYQNSIGSARMVVTLVGESLGRRSTSGSKL
jgi:D-amino-acid oxidase